MKKTVRLHDFAQAFHDYDRGNQFTTLGLMALFEYFEDLERDIGEEIELDVIAICIEYTEYADLAEIQTVYHDLQDMDDLEDNTHVIVTNKSIIIRDY